MLVDTKGLHQEHVGQRLRIDLASGESNEISLLELTVCPEPEPCCGITYTLLSTNRPGGDKEPGGTYWTAFGEVKHFQVLGG